MWELWKVLLKTSTSRLLLIFGFVLAILAFVTVGFKDGHLAIESQRSPNWILLCLALVLVSFFIWTSWPRRSGFHSTKKVPNGYAIEFGDAHVISVVTGAIQDTLPEEHSAVVLPANTSFDDECVRDSRTSLGSFFQKHFPTGTEQLQKEMRRLAALACAQTDESFVMAPPGTTIMLNKPLGTEYTILVTAVTTADAGKIITADTLSLVASVKQVFRVASENRLSALYMPVMGTGHGGLDFKTALHMLLLQCKHCMQHEGLHLVHRVTIVVYDPDRQRQSTTDAVVKSVG
jgi:O-acetyl-ADP-ribose deacetylase (regulator of RNase III)